LKKEKIFSPLKRRQAMNRRVFILLAIFMLLYSLSYAGEMLADEAINYYNAGVRAQRAGDYETADASYQKALILNNNDYWRKHITNNYGAIYAIQGDLKKAEELFNEALSMDPNFKPAQLNLGLIYDRKHDKLKAIEYWLKALDINLDELKPKQFVIEEKVSVGQSQQPLE